jgi:hypothetical protein
MKALSRKKLLSHIAINLVIPMIIVLIESYISRPEVILSGGILKYVGLILTVPGFYIILLLTGPTYATHSAGGNLFLLTNFIFYFVVIAVVQIIILRKRER